MLRDDNISFIRKCALIQYHETPEKTYICHLTELFDRIDFSSCSFRTKLVIGLSMTARLRELHHKGYCLLNLSLESFEFSQKADGLQAILKRFFLLQKGPHFFPIAPGELINCHPAPELIRGRLTHQPVPISTSLDLWNLGDLLYELLYGYSCLKKFELTSRNVEHFMDQATKMREHLDQQESSPIHMCISKLFSLNPEERPQADEVFQTIQTTLSTLERPE